MRKPELGQRVVERRLLSRIPRMRGLRPLGLQPPLDAVAIGEFAQLRRVALGNRLQVAQHEHGHVLAHRELELRDAVAQLHRR